MFPNCKRYYLLTVICSIGAACFFYINEHDRSESLLFISIIIAVLPTVMLVFVICWLRGVMLLAHWLCQTPLLQKMQQRYDAYALRVIAWNPVLGEWILEHIQGKFQRVLLILLWLCIMLFFLLITLALKAVHSS